MVPCLRIAQIDRKGGCLSALRAQRGHKLLQGRQRPTDQQHEGSFARRKPGNLAPNPGGSPCYYDGRSQVLTLTSGPVRRAPVARFPAWAHIAHPLISDDAPEIITRTSANHWPIGWGGLPRRHTIRKPY
jgi:hypothetical protein